MAASSCCFSRLSQSCLVASRTNVSVASSSLIRCFTVRVCAQLNSATGPLANSADRNVADSNPVTYDWRNELNDSASKRRKKDRVPSMGESRLCYDINERAVLVGLLHTVDARWATKKCALLTRPRFRIPGAWESWPRAVGCGW